MRIATAVLVCAAGVAAIVRAHDVPVSPSAAAAAATPEHLDTIHARASRSAFRHWLHRQHAYVRRPVWARWMDVTEYCATGSPTASGQWPYIGGAATLDRSIPFGTRLDVPGVGEVTVNDRIGWGSDLDMYEGDAGCEARASAWGRQRLLVTAVVQ